VQESQSKTTIEKSKRDESELSFSCWKAKMQARSDFTEIFNNMSGILDKSKLSALARELRKIYVDQEDLQIHIIGRQAIFIGKHFGKIIDTLHTENETKKQELIRHVLYLLFHLLRDMSVIWSKYEYTDADKEMENLKKYGNMIYNLFSLFFRQPMDYLRNMGIGKRSCC